MPISVATSVRGAATPLRALVRGALVLEGRRAGEVAVVLTDDAALRALNRRWRGLDRATDVLSFPYEEGATVHGDIIVSMDRVGVQARRYRVSRGRELARLVIHGALHLAGLDHHAVAGRRHMRAQERRALRAAAATIMALDGALRAQ